MYQPPKGPGVRVDDGFEEGQEIPVFYDSMIAKLVAWAPTRDESIDRLCRAIDEYYVQGIQTTLNFGKWAVQTEPFRTGNFDTKFIEKYYKPEYLQQQDADAEEVAAILGAFVWDKDKKVQSAAAVGSNTVGGWKLRRK
jgi:acetyl-CoA carboxylase biotin carboxylase subunit/propionyl-CoA carboxylase alpha chain